MDLNINDVLRNSLNSNVLCLLPFVKIGVTLASFHSVGTIPEEIDWLNKNARDGARTPATMLIILGGIEII